MTKATLAAFSVSLLSLTACANNSAVQGGAIGAGAGAAVGAVIGNNVGDGDAETGALIGAAVGAVGGALAGCARDGGCEHNPNNPNHSQLIYDQFSDRYYYIDQTTGDTYWQNGTPRTRANP